MCTVPAEVAPLSRAPSALNVTLVNSSFPFGMNDVSEPCVSITRIGRFSARLVMMATTCAGCEKQREVERFVNGALLTLQKAVAERGEDAAVTALATQWSIQSLHVRRLWKKGEAYLSTMRLVFAGFSYPEVAEKLAVTRREVELVVGYVEEILAARKFATSSG